MSPEARALAAELVAEADSLRAANADAPTPPAAAIAILRATRCPVSRQLEDAQ
jgi:hypothetical protein